MLERAGGLASCTPCSLLLLLMNAIAVPGPPSLPQVPGGAHRGLVRHLPAGAGPLLLPARQPAVRLAGHESEQGEPLGCCLIVQSRETVCFANLPPTCMVHLAHPPKPCRPSMSPPWRSTWPGSCGSPSLREPENKPVHTQHRPPRSATSEAGWALPGNQPHSAVFKRTAQQVHCHLPLPPCLAIRYIGPSATPFQYPPVHCSCPLNQPCCPSCYILTSCTRSSQSWVLLHCKQARSRSSTTVDLQSKTGNRQCITSQDQQGGAASWHQPGMRRNSPCSVTVPASKRIQQHRGLTPRTPL